MRDMWADWSLGGVEDFCAAKAAMVSKATTANRRERARFIVEASWAEIVAYRQPGSGKPGQAQRRRENGELAKTVDSRAGEGGGTPLPFFSQVFILKVVSRRMQSFPARIDGPTRTADVTKSRLLNAERAEGFGAHCFTNRIYACDYRFVNINLRARGI
jgi:hypothetical protein